MVAIICLFWIGSVLSAPTWYNVLLAIALAFRLICFGIEVNKIWQKEPEDKK